MHNMSIIFKYPGILTHAKVISRGLSSSCMLCTKQWRLKRGLSVNRNAEGILTDGPDFTYLDGRPSPMLYKQKVRMQRQRDYAARMVELCSELEFAKDRHKQMTEEKEKEREQIIANRLKPKGQALLQKKK